MSDVDELLKRFEERNKGVDKEEEDIEEDTEESIFKNSLFYEDLPLALCRLNNVDYLACITEGDGIYSYPMMFQERLEPVMIEPMVEGAEPKQEFRLRIEIVTPHKAGLMMKKVFMNFDMVYVLDKNISGDRRLLEMYKKVVDDYRFEEAGIAKPSTEDTIALNSGK